MEMAVYSATGASKHHLIHELEYNTFARSIFKWRSILPHSLKQKQCIPNNVLLLWKVCIFYSKIHKMGARFFCQRLTNPFVTSACVLWVSDGLFVFSMTSLFSNVRVLNSIFIGVSTNHIATEVLENPPMPFRITEYKCLRTEPK